MTHTYVFTGFPGFLAVELLKDLFRTRRVEHIYLLHLSHTEKEARRRLLDCLEDPAVDPSRITLLSGDITKKNLGLDAKTAQKLKQELTHFYHLAALYDLAVPLAPALQVNVQGTREVLRFLQGCTGLNRCLYFSTAYVSGRRQGPVYEHELEHNHGFKNHYEYTKYEAEKLVREYRILPITIVRPGIVVGHTRTGSTAKFDGPYYILNLLNVLKSLPVVPYFGKGKARVNLVPHDYVVQAANVLTHLPEREGKTYHLTDPHPYTAKDIYHHFTHLYADKQPHLTVPLSAARQPLKLKQIRRKLGIRREALDYFETGADYEASNAENDLKSSGLYCPDLFYYTQPLIRYYEEHKNDPAKHASLL
ncbi:SDR family oxidoreductase [Halobacillus litoralis]|uniref:SDR family oxidoreductase n=1 Tax=Halobacillus litoralis TaxID=45668 RepID=UPI00136B819A|nr:SDR family oxidoreductase [Halobacillus litoralis]MYL39868.1 NAD-dependent epimerase/dehydratase family protein [Halobacillus litoralis]